MSLEQRVAALEQIIIQQNTSRLDRLEQSAIEADKRLTRLENLAERAENRLDRLEKAVADNTAAISRLEQVTTKHSEAINHLQQSVSDLKEVTIKHGEAIDRLEKAIEKLDQKVDNGFKQLSNQISSLGFRWGVHNESIWRQTIASVLEKSYGVIVKRLDLGTDEIDVIISNGDHIIIEITSRFHSRDVAKVVRKRQLYTDQVQAPSRFIVAAASIHSKVTQQLTNLGFEVIEPDED